MATTQRTARAVSYVLNPLILPPVLFATVVSLAGGEIGEVFAAAGLTLFFFALVPLIPMIRETRARPESTLELRDRLRRTGPYATGVVSYLVCIPALRVMNLPPPEILLGMVICFIINGILLMVINLSWKISLHVSTIAGCFSILGFVMIRLLATAENWGRLGMAVLLTIAVSFTTLVMWARVRDHAHSVSQVVAGAIFGFVLPLVELATLEKMGLFDTF